MYKQIPNFSDYLISEKGELIDKNRNVVLGFTNRKGYYHFSIKRDDDKTVLVGRHRLVGFVYVENKTGLDFDELVINHLNSTPGDDFASNLEWVTPKMNVEYSGEYGDGKCTPIIARDVSNGLELEFPSIIECARKFNLSRDAVNYRVKSDGIRIFPEGFQYKAKGSTSDWGQENKYGRAISILSRDIDSGEVLEFASYRKAAKHFNISPALILECINDSNKITEDFIQFKKNDGSKWQNIEDSYLALEYSTGKKPVVMIDQTLGFTSVYISAAECARKLNLNPTALHYQLTKKITGKEHFVYRYYSELHGSPIREVQ